LPHIYCRHWQFKKGKIMNTQVADQKSITQPKPAKKKKLIGDRGDYFLGWREDLLKSSTIWVCLSCEMCTTYCPNEVGVAEVINHLRNIAAHSSITPKERNLAVFHQTFLEVLRKSGRVNEFRLMNAYYLKPNILHEKIKSGSFKEELILGLTLLRKGRLKLFTSKSKAIKDIQKAYIQARGEIV